MADIHILQGIIKKAGLYLIVQQETGSEAGQWDFPKKVLTPMEVATEYSVIQRYAKSAEQYYACRDQGEILEDSIAALKARRPPDLQKQWLETYAKEELGIDIEVQPATHITLGSGRDGWYHFITARFADYVSGAVKPEVYHAWLPLEDIEHYKLGSTTTQLQDALMGRGR
ncbi:hypothetical protein KY362_00215 [Candidatus Woesearchaeota archaeon]|nr:hypothetical protein [Candidatus Woesearchaeota archaeon]